MKRFTETEKWRDPWFQKLDKESRTLWLWLCDRVDNAGVTDICWPICNAETAGSFSEESMIHLGEKVEKLENGKWWIPSFISFQVGKLSSHCKPHIYIMDLIKKHGLEDRVWYRVSDKVSSTFKEKEKEKEQEKDKDKEKVKVLEKPQDPQAVKVLERLNEKAGTRFRPVNGSLKLITERLKEGFTVEDCFAVIETKVQSWKGEAKTREWLNPHTLFRKEKFPEYVGQIVIQPKTELIPKKYASY